MPTMIINFHTLIITLPLSIGKVQEKLPKMSMMMKIILRIPLVDPR